MKKVIVRYAAASDEERRESVILLGPADELRAKRELAGKEYGRDSDYVLYYRTFLAARRAAEIGQAVTFDQWLETVDEVEPRLTLKEIDTAEAVGKLSEAEANVLRERVHELGDDAPGESPTPRA